jgi:pyruvate formate lyase activating enzyme
MIDQRKNSYFIKKDSLHLQCQLCPHHCILKEGQRGLCGPRGNVNGEIKNLHYGTISGMAVDPIEKKPLYHFYPGHHVLSFGTFGCNLLCTFCQNCGISRLFDGERLAGDKENFEKRVTNLLGVQGIKAGPDEVVSAAINNRCKSIAVTYNEPTISIEYNQDVFLRARGEGVKTVLVSNGYVDECAREDLFENVDAVNIDLKSFSESFYKKLTGGHLGVVLDTLKYLVQEKKETWLEVTTLIIPGENDSASEIDELTTWFYRNLGADVPLHFSAFHPAWKMTDRGRTPPATLYLARDMAMNKGINYVYTGNILDTEGSSTFCPQCKCKLISRPYYEVESSQIGEDGACSECGYKIPGFF